ncbi:unnamed protein product [Ambrosiozyma monospora]|uniref:Unnamed protein product n=1 Tax=Ambrosiozyma monospora TaxID=43982 RepID=A0ACB5UC40_AMBMO|nr:unnamed protein product [Ambrosiozyma monospora]
MESMMEMLVKNLLKEKNVDLSSMSSNSSDIATPVDGENNNADDQETEDEMICDEEYSNKDIKGCIDGIADDNKEEDSMLGEKMVFGKHSSISIFSKTGVNWMASKFKDPYVMFPLKNMMTNMIRLEPEIFSVWVDPIDRSKVSPLPPRNIVESLLHSTVNLSFFDKSLEEKARTIAKSYCDYRDGLIPEPRFTYGELLLLNAILLLSCTIHLDKSKVGLVPENERIAGDVLEKYGRYFLDNTLFYFHRVALVSDGLTVI